MFKMVCYTNYCVCWNPSCNTNNKCRKILIYNFFDCSIRGFIFRIINYKATIENFIAEFLNNFKAFIMF